MSEPGGASARVVRNALLKGAVQATRLLSLTLLVMTARVIGPESFGKFTFAYALATLLGAGLDLGIPAVLVRSVARSPAEAGAGWATAATLKLGLLVPLGFVLAGVPLVTHRPPDTTLAVWLLGAAIALQSFIELAVSIFTGFERLEWELGLRLVEKLVLVAVGVTGLLLGGGLVLVSAAFAVSAAVSLVLGTALVHHRFAPVAWTWHPGRARALLGTQGPVALAFVLAFATTRLVPLLVALLGGDVPAGYFGAAARVLDVVMVIPVALTAAVFPVLARTAASDPRFRDVTARAAEILLLLGAPIVLGLAFGARWLTGWVYGAPYAPAAPVLAVLGAAAILGFLNYFFAVVLLALDRPGRLAGASAVGLGASLLLTPALVRAFGAVGGAVALGLVEAVTLAAGLLGLVPLVGVPFRGGALKVAAAAGGAALLALGLPSQGGWRLGAALVVYAGGVLVLQPVPGGLWGPLFRGVPWAPGHR